MVLIDAILYSQQDMILRLKADYLYFLMEYS